MEFFNAVRHGYTINGSRILQALKMVCTPEDKCPARSFVGANPLEYGGAIMKCVAGHVYHAVCGFPQLTVEPYPCIVTHHLSPIRACNFKEDFSALIQSITLFFKVGCDIEPKGHPPASPITSGLQPGIRCGRDT
jgi:hypothetical protein